MGLESCFLDLGLGLDRLVLVFERLSLDGCL
jgi:hypothetical protein